MRYISIIYIIINLFASTMNAQIITIKSDLSSDSILIGDQVVFRLSINMDKNVQVEFPVISDTLTKEIEVLIPLSADTLSEGEKKTITQSYLVTSFEEGMHIIPALRVVYSTDQFTDTALSMPMLINVYAPSVDTTQAIRPIKPPVNTPISLKEVVPWILISYAGLLVLTLIIALIWMYTQKDKDPEVFAALKQDPPHIVAFRELDKLKEGKLWEKGRVKEFYTQLTEIIRIYIERQYGIHAMESTTDEILTTFSNISNEDELLDEMLLYLLNQADLVKFAKEDPQPVENQTNLNNAYLFVQKTYPFFFREELEVKEEETDEVL